LDLSGGNNTSYDCIATSISLVNGNCQVRLNAATQVCCVIESVPIPSTDFCPLNADAMGLSYSCATNQAFGTCAERFTPALTGLCVTYVAALANTTTTDNCLLIGFNSSTNTVDCDFYTVLENCCDPQFDALTCSLDLETADQYAAYV
jgi:hypothetical protein